MERGGEDFVDAVVVDVDDFKAPIGVFEKFPFLRDAAKRGENEAAQRVEVAVIFVGQIRNPEFSFHFIDRQ